MSNFKQPLADIEKHKTIYAEYFSLIERGFTRRTAIRMLIRQKFIREEIVKVIEYENSL